MGQNIFKPRKVPLKINNVRSNTNGHVHPQNVDINPTDNIKINNVRINTNGHVHPQNPTDDISTYVDVDKIIDVVRDSYNNFIRDESEDIVDGDLKARGVRNKRPMSEDKSYRNCGTKFQRRELPPTNVQLFDDVFSMSELIDYFDRCEKNSVSSDDPKSEEEDPFENLSKAELSILLLDKKVHLELAADPQSFPKFTYFMDLASTNHLLEHVIDLADSEGNPAISIALLNNNLKAFFFLLKRQAQLPLYIFTKKREVAFLNYVALNGKICKSPKSFEYLLEPVLNILIKYYPERTSESETNTIKTFLCEVDKETNLSLPHLLLTIYQNYVDLRTRITACLKLCLKAYPQSFDVHCSSYYCPMYKFDMITHSLILPETNYEIIEQMLFGKIINKHLYKQLVRVHSDPRKRDKLTKIIDDSST